MRKIVLLMGFLTLFLAMVTGCFGYVTHKGGLNWNYAHEPTVTHRMVAATMDVVTMPVQAPFFAICGLGLGLEALDKKLQALEHASEREEALQEARSQPKLLESAQARYSCEGTRLGATYHDLSIPFSEKALVTQALQYQGRTRGYLVSPSNEADMVALMRRPEWTPRALEAMATQFYLSFDRGKVYNAYLEHPNLPSHVRESLSRQPTFREWRGWNGANLKKREGESRPGGTTNGVEGGESPAAKLVRTSFGNSSDYAVTWRIGGDWSVCAIGALKHPVAFTGAGYQGRVTEIYVDAPNVKIPDPSKRVIAADATYHARVGAIVCAFDTPAQCQAFLRDLVPECRFSDPAFWDQLAYRPSLDCGRCYAICTERRKVPEDSPCQIFILDLSMPSQYRFWPPEQTYHHAHVWWCDTN